MIYRFIARAFVTRSTTPMDHDGDREVRAATTPIASWPKGSFVENLAVDPDGLALVTFADPGVHRFEGGEATS